MTIDEKLCDYATDRQQFTGLVESRLVNAGHAVPSQRPEAVAQAIIDLLGTRSTSGA